MPAAEKQIYHKLALVYDHLMRNIRYDLWAEYIYNISKKYIGSNAKGLELGAGNGNLSRYIVKYYKNLITTDISLSMLARINCKTSRIVCDMTRLPFKKKFDLVFSAFDSVNYLLTRKKLSALFNEVARILTPDGIFLFDISLEKNSFKHSHIPYSSGNYKGVNYINKSSYNRRKGVHTNLFKIKVNETIYTEVHKQKIYPFETYFSVIEKTSLYPAECYDAFTFNNGNSECDRIQFVLKTKK